MSKHKHSGRNHVEARMLAYLSRRLELTPASTVTWRRVEEKRFSKCESRSK